MYVLGLIWCSFKISIRNEKTKGLLSTLTLSNFVTTGGLSYVCWGMNSLQNLSSLRHSQIHLTYVQSTAFPLIYLISGIALSSDPVTPFKFLKLILPFLVFLLLSLSSLPQPG